MACFNMVYRFYFYWWILRGDSKDPGLLSVQFLSFSTSFRQISCQIIGFDPKFRGELPRLANPGCATDFVITGGERLIQSHSSARFCFELGGNSN